MAMIVSIQCPSCETTFPVDPDKVPAGGARTECTECETPFRVDSASWGDDVSVDAPWTASTESSAGDDVMTLPDTPVEEWSPAGEDWGGDSAEDDTPDAAWSESFESDDSVSSPLDEGTHDETVATDSGGFGDPTEPPQAFDAVEVEGSADEDSAELPEVEDSDDEAPITAGLEELVSEGEESIDVAMDAAPAAEVAEDESGDDEMWTGADLKLADDLTSQDDVPAPTDQDTASTGDIVTDQWADLVDDADTDEVEISSAWGEDGGDAWVLETEEAPAAELGDIELERLDTVEEHVRAAQEDPDLTEPAAGVDANGVPEIAGNGFGDFMTGSETMLPEDALEVGGSGLHLEEEAPEGEVHAESTDFGLEVETRSPETGAASEGAEEEVTFQFGRRDPHDKARRLARVLVSDMITYNPDRHSQALHNGSVKPDFEEEIEKSWAEYVEQVGPEIAESTDYWRDALNEILAGDQPLF